MFYFTPNYSNTFRTLNLLKYKLALSKNLNTQWGYLKKIKNTFVVILIEY
jgi:hypothetical protein